MLKSFCRTDHATLNGIVNIKIYTDCVFFNDVELNESNWLKISDPKWQYGTRSNFIRIVLKQENVTRWNFVSQNLFARYEY